MAWGATATSGAQRVAALTGLDAHLRTADLMLTGDMARAMMKIHAKPPRPKPPRPEAAATGAPPAKEPAP